MTPEVCVVILTWNQRETTLACLARLRGCSYPRARIVLVDNGSTDGTAAAVRAAFPEVDLLALPENLGCAGGRNVGIAYFLRRTDAPYMMMLDNDVEVQPDFVERTLDVFARHPETGVVGGMVLDADGGRVQWAGARIDWARGRFSTHNGAGPSEPAEGPTDGVIGGITFGRREAFAAVSVIDESYFIYFEDPDWSVRVRKAGFGLRFSPGIRYLHHASSSLGMESPGFYYYRTRNRLVFFMRHGRGWQRLAFLAWFFLWDYPYGTLATLRLSGMERQLRASVAGVADWARGRLGKREFAAEGDPLLDRPPGAVVSRAIDRGAVGLFQGARRAWRRAFSRDRRRILVDAAWRLGDEVSLLPAYEALAKRHPGADIVVRCNHPELLAGSRWARPAAGDSAGEEPDIVLNRADPSRSRRWNMERAAGVRAGGWPALAGGRRPVPGRVGICAGAGWECKRWPSAGFAALAELLRARGMEVWSFGSAGEWIGVGEDRTGTPLAGTIGNLRTVAAYVGNDSGVLHLALALGVPSVGLFGPTDPAMLFMDNPLLTALVTPVSCRGCVHDGRMAHWGVCPYGKADCMDAIPVEAVCAAVEKRPCA